MGYEILDVKQYVERYGLQRGFVPIKEIKPPFDINMGGLLMHGSEADPYAILKFGLIPQINRNIDDEYQICLGVTVDDASMSLKIDLARKNPAVKFAGYFSPDGVVYVIHDGVRLLPSYREVKGDGGVSLAWIAQPLPSNYILGVITENVTLAAAAMFACDETKPIFKPDGTCFILTHFSDD